MFTLKLTCLILLCGTTFAMSITGYKGSSRKFTLRSIDVGDPAAARSRMARSSQVEFPEELRYVMNVDGMGDVNLNLVRDRNIKVPNSYSYGNGTQYEKHKLNTERIGFYKEKTGLGSFACKMEMSAGGQHECSITAIVDFGEENCYLSKGADTLDCSVKQNGQPFVFADPKIDPNIPVFDRETARRQRRSILEPDGFRAVEVAYLPDAKFTDLFYRRHPDDIATAEAEMDLFFILLTSEINVFFTTLQETQLSLRIQVYNSVVAYPGYQQNFPWSENNNDGTYLSFSSSLQTNLEFIINDSGFITGQWDFVFAITGFNLRDGTNGNPLVSYTHQSVICTDSTKKYALTEFTGYNLPRILAHELGHGLGALHDDDTSCSTGTNIMSQNMFNPTSATKDTFYRFSSCSGADMETFIFSINPSCLLQNAFTYEQYEAQFCQGLAGFQSDYLDKQCERLTNIVGSTACESANETSCYARNIIRCTDGTGQCSDSSKLQYVWNGTPCGTGKFCYLGNCVDSFNICPTSSTTTTTSTTTTSTTTTSTTTTSTTTTPTTTTTTPTTTTTTPTTTTTLPETSCNCCVHNKWLRKKKCCEKGQKRAGVDCYCCGAYKGIQPPDGWTGKVY